MAERDPSADLKGPLTPVRARHHSSITDPKQIGGLCYGQSIILAAHLSSSVHYSLHHWYLYVQVNYVRQNGQRLIMIVRRQGILD